MWFRSMLESLARSPRRRKQLAASRNQRARRLLLEGLEDRNLMAFDVLAEYATGAAPQEVTLALVNADTRPDMIVANLNGNSIDVRLGNADGTFGPAQTSPTGAGPRSVATGDFTGDGIVDAVTANAADASLLVGNGDGTFQAPQSIALPPQVAPSDPSQAPLPQTLASVATGDLDDDGNLDLVVAGSTYFTYCPYYCYTTYDGYVNVLLGNGTGGFGAAATDPLGTDRLPIAVAVEDIDGDTHADVITANSFNGLSVLLGDGTGAVGSPIHSGFGSGVRSISLGDVDGDGNLDSLSSSGSGLYVQKGDGLGGFTTQPHLNLGIPVNSAVMGDVNDDGKLDLVAAGSLNEFHCTSYGYWGCYDGYHTSTRQTSVLIGNGLGNFSLPLTSNIGAESNYGWLADVAVGDLNGDSLPELITVDSNGNEAIVAANDGDWNPPPAIVISDATTIVEDGAATAVFRITIVGDHDGVSVDYSTVANTASAGSDYTARSGKLTFGIGESSQEISVPILGDAIDEYDESFFLNLSNAVGGILTDSQAIGTIQDNDEAPLVTIRDVSRNEGNRRQNTSFVFAVDLSAASAKWVYVDFTTADGTARFADGDYFANSNTISIAPGTTTGTLTVTVRGDKGRELNETFVVNLTGATDGTISDSQGVGTIVNDDGGSGKGKGNSSASAGLIAALLADETLTNTRKRK